MAQLGRALGSGPRGRWFKSSRPDHLNCRPGACAPGLFRVCCVRDAICDLLQAPARSRFPEILTQIHLAIWEKPYAPRPRASFVARRHHQRQSQVQGYRLQTQSCGRELRPSCEGLSAWQTQRIAPFAARPSYALPARTWQRVPRAPAGQYRMPAGRSHCLPSSASLRPMSLPSEHTQKRARWPCSPAREGCHSEVAVRTTAAHRQRRPAPATRIPPQTKVLS